jgi:hypothetical protein
MHRSLVNDEADAYEANSLIIDKFKLRCKKNVFAHAV